MTVATMANDVRSIEASAATDADHQSEIDPKKVFDPRANSNHIVVENSARASDTRLMKIARRLISANPMESASVSIRICGASCCGVPGDHVANRQGVRSARIGSRADARNRTCT